MQCPFCKSNNVEVPTVDIGVGEQQCGPAACEDCGASQDSNGKWQQYDDGHGVHDVRIGRTITFTDGEGKEHMGVIRDAQYSDGEPIGLVVEDVSENCQYGGVFFENGKWVMKALRIL